MGISNHSANICNSIVIYLITFYQEVISPFKGFSCAYCHEFGGVSCSEYVKRVAQKRGVLTGFGDIRLRFRACKQASLKIQHRSSTNQDGILDCGFDGCGDIGSCFDSGGGSSGSTVLIVFPSGILLLLLIFGGVIWYQGPEVNSIDIRLIESKEEVKEKGLALIIGGKLPDYQVIFDVKGKKIATQTLNNSSAKKWLTLEPKSQFKITDINRITIVNKQVLKDHVLDVIENPSEQGMGKLYEYKLEQGLINF